MTAPRPGNRSVLGMVFLIVFLDITGFSIIFPLFPRMLEYYVGQEGPHSVVGQLNDWLSNFAAGDENAVRTLFGGFLGSLYAVLQFVFAPVWGGLSDRIGRRHTLLLTLAGTAASYVLWVFADNFTLLVIARLIGGAMAGNIATAAAVVADVSSGPERAKGMGIVGMAIGLGFILGPAIGGGTFADPVNVYVQAPSTAAWGFHPFTSPAFAALLLASLNLLWVSRRLPETLLPEHRGERHTTATLNPFHRIKTLDFPGVAKTHWMYFLYLTAFAAMEFTLTFLAAERLDYGVGAITAMFVYTGLVIAFVQGGIVRRVVPKHGERKIATLGLITMLPGFLLIGFTYSTWMLYLGLTFLAFGSGLAMPAISSLVSRYVPSDRQGLAQGTLRSLGSLSRAVGPILGGVLYWRFGSASPYWIGALLLLLPISMSVSLPPIAEGA